jgi:hypothetical protein
LTDAEMEARANEMQAYAVALDEKRRGTGKPGEL